MVDVKNPLDNILLKCENCKEETLHSYMGKLLVEHTIQKYGKKPVQKSEVKLNYSCTVCNSPSEILERRAYVTERRKN